jgi:pyruvate,orthophosphate dikinase
VSHVYDFDHPHDLPLPEVKALIGGKAANIAVMARELGLPVPPAFTIGTAACRAYLSGGWPAGLDEEIRQHMTRIETLVGRRFGDPADPLLVSARSGAPVSMPGMMDTILDLGLNDATTGGLGRASGDPAFAADCQARFIAMYRETVGVDVVPDDPWEQLRGAVEAVFRSWNSARARAFRAHEGIPDDLGTAVTIQAMVFGNRGLDSGTGVLFTRNPATGEPTLYGDVMFGAQGEDVVSGSHHTEPISVLDERMPAVAAELRRHAEALERHYADLCDIEFTIEQGRLWMLQVRVGKRSPQAALRIAVDMAEDRDFPLTREDAVRRVTDVLVHPPLTTTERDDAVAIATGLPASPGVASGEIATSPDAAVAIAEAGRAAILVRAQTSPDDVHGMAKAVGILTSSGGLASHAAVVARGWGIPAVVGADAVEVEDGSVVIAGRRLGAGDTITIDGATGEVFEGAVVGRCVIVPEAAILLDWARQLGVTIGGAAEEAAVEAGGGPPAREAAGIAADVERASLVADDVVRLLVVKGYATPESAASALLCTPEEASGLLDRLVADGLAEIAAGSFRLTPDGKAIGGERIAADAAQWGAERATAALDTFLALDHRMKETVTAWQMREVDGAQTFNDHGDPEYDADVLARLGALHADACAWLGPLAAGLPRLDAYRERLDRAATLAREGDHRYVASPRVDSYHSVWFELHEDLILLAGRNRADEVAAGRA